MDYNKEVALPGPKTWDDTCLYLVDKDPEYTDNLDALSKAGVANMFSLV